MSEAATTKPANAEPIRWIGAPKKVTSIQAFEKTAKENSNITKRGFPITTFRNTEPGVPPAPAVLRRRDHTFVAKPTNESKKKPQIGYERTDFTHSQGEDKEGKSENAKNDRVHFLETAPVRKELSYVTTQAGNLTVRTSKPYESLMAERDSLLQSERAYKRRIKSLEGETEQLLQNFEVLYKENKLLREKLETGDDHHIESYQRVYADREVLREAEAAYKKRIYQLEIDAKEMIKSFDSLYAENRVLRQKAEKLEERLNSEDRLNDLRQLSDFQKQNSALKKTIDKLGYENQQQKQERDEMEFDVIKLKEEVSDHERKISMLERENEALKRGFEAIGKVDRNQRKKEALEEERERERRKESLLEDERRREELEAESENAADIIRALREKIDELRERNFDIKTEMEGVQKVNIALSVKNDMLEKEKETVEARLMELAKQREGETSHVKKDKEIEELRKEVKRLSKLSVDVKSQNDTLEKKNIEVRVKNEILEKDKAEFEKRLFDLAKEMKREISDAKKQVKQKEMVSKKETQPGNTAETTDKPMLIPPGQRLIDIATHDEMEKNLKLLQAQVIALHVDVKSAQEESSRLKDELRNADARLREQMGKMEQEKAKLSTSATTAEAAKLEQIIKIHDDNVRLNEDIRHMTEENEKQKKTIEKLEATNSEQAEALTTRQKELDNLRTRAKDSAEIQNDLSRVEYEKNKIRKEKEEMERLFNEERKKLEFDLQDARNNIEYTSNVLAEMKGKYESLQNERNMMTAEGASLLKANEWQTKELGDIRAENDNLKRELSAKETKLMEMEQEVKTMTSELKDTKTALTQTKKELEIVSNEKENQVNKLLKELNTLKAEREVETGYLKEQGKTLKEEVERLKVFEYRMAGVEDELKEFIEKLSKAESRNTALTNEKVGTLGRLVNVMKTENSAIRHRQQEQEKHELEKQRLEMEMKRETLNDIQRLVDENKRLRALLEKKRAKEVEKEDWENKRNKFDEVQASNQRLVAENKRLLNALDLNNIELVRKDLEQASEKIKVLESSNAVYSDENTKLRLALDQQAKEMREWQIKKDFVNSLQDRIKRQLDEIQRLREEIGKKEAMLQELKELKGIKEKLIDANANNTRLYEENRRLRQTIEEQREKKKPAHQIALENLQRAGQQEVAKRQQEDVNAELKEQAEKLKITMASNTKLRDETERLRKTAEEQNMELMELKKIKEIANSIKEKNVRLEMENDRLRNELLELELNTTRTARTRKLHDERTEANRTPIMPTLKHDISMKENLKNEEKQKHLDKIKVLETSNFRYMNENAQLREERERLAMEIRDLESYRDKVDRLRDKNELLEKEAERLRNELERLDPSASATKLVQKADKQEKRPKPKAKISKETKETKETISDAERLRKAEREAHFLTEKVNRLESNNAKLVELNAALKSNNSELEDTIRELDARVDRTENLQDKVKRLEDENRRLREELESLDLDMRASKATTAKLTLQKSEVGKSSVDIEEQQRQLDVLKEKNRRLTNETSRLRQELNQKEEMMKELQELQGVQAKLRDAMANNTRLYEENRRLREALDDATNRKAERKLQQNTKLERTAQWAVHVDKKGGVAVVEKSKDGARKRSGSLDYTDNNTALPEIKHDSSASLITGLGYKALHRSRAKAAQNAKTPVF